MEFKKTAIEGVYIIEPRVFNDARGYFFEAWKKEELARIEKLKIVTPNNLIETYKKVNAFGKKKEGKSVEGE